MPGSIAVDIKILGNKVKAGIVRRPDTNAMVIPKKRQIRGHSKTDKIDFVRFVDIAASVRIPKNPYKEFIQQKHVSNAL